MRSLKNTYVILHIFSSVGTVSLARQALWDCGDQNQRFSGRSMPSMQARTRQPRGAARTGKPRDIWRVATLAGVGGCIVTFAYFSDPDREPDRDEPHGSSLLLAALQAQHATALAEWFRASLAARRAQTERESAESAGRIAELDAQLTDLELRIVEAQQGASRGHGAID